MSNSAGLASSSSPPVIPLDSASLHSSSSPPVIPMDRRLRQLLKACNKGDFSLCNHLIIADPDILLSTTPHKNNCLHIAAMLGHEEFAKEVWSRAPSLFSGTNIDGETPLIAALMAANLSLAFDIITAASQSMQHNDLEEGRPFNRMLLKVDRRGENALHHAMRNGLQNLALQILEIEPLLSEQVTNIGESPMYMAARRGYSGVVERLLEIPFSADSGPNNYSPMQVAVRYGHTGIVMQLLSGRPQLAYCKGMLGFTMLAWAVMSQNQELVKIFLEFDPNLAYITNEETKDTPFLVAAQLGSVSIAKVIRSFSPDSVYIPNKDGNSALHVAIQTEQLDFIDYIQRTPQLHGLINQANKDGSLPLHEAAHMCNPKLLRLILSFPRLDLNAFNSSGDNAKAVALLKMGSSKKTLKEIESLALLSDEISFKMQYLLTEAQNSEVKKEAMKDIKSLTKKYITSTSLVAALLATITFAAAFTLPGGYSNDPTDAGLPIFARKVAFQVFLISDTIAMCSSLSVTFLCILTTWEDLDILLNYRKTTRALMWCAYGATALSFGTGLFTVLAPNNLWLAILILVFCTILPFLSKIISEWPLLKIRYRLGSLFQKDLVPNI